MLDLLKTDPPFTNDEGELSLPVSMYEEAENDFSVLVSEPNDLEKQKHRLAELLDENQSYVNMSEMNDMWL